MYTIMGANEPVTEAQVILFEDVIGCALPSEFRVFLLRNNGGKINPKRFVTKDGKIESMVSTFFPLSGEPSENLLEEFEGFNAAKQIPRNLISIAKDPADNRLVLSTGGKDVGAIYYWAWDEEPTPTTNSYSYMRIITESFDEFLTILR